MGCVGGQILQALNLGFQLVEGGLYIGQCGERWIFVLMVDMNSQLFGGDTNVSVGVFVEASISAGLGTVLLELTFFRSGGRSDRRNSSRIRNVEVTHANLKSSLRQI